MERQRRQEIENLISQAILSNPNGQTVITHIPKADVQETLDAAWEKLDDSAPTITPTLSLDAQALLLRKLCLKLSVKHDILPTNFHVTGVVCLDKEPVDSGGFADIYHGRYKGSLVILKRPRITNEESRERIMIEFCRESLLWSRLSHNHVLPFWGISRDAFQRSFCMVLPRMEAGNIRRRILSKAPDKQLTEADFEPRVNHWLYEVILGLKYLHDQGIVHGDLHGGNILIDDDDTVRLTDFGFALIAAATPGGYGSKHGGAAHHFVAPELFEPREFDMEYPRPTPASDIYAFGCTCIELYTGKMPFTEPKITTYRISKKVLRGDRPSRPFTPFGSRMSDPMWNIVQKCWAQQPATRLSAEGVVLAMQPFAR